MTAYARAYARALADLRDQHRDEFDQLLEFHRALTDVEHIAERASLLALNAEEINDG